MTRYDDTYSYEILADGYNIYRNEKPDEIYISQLEPYAKIYVPNGTYEENCLAQLEELTKAAQPQPNVIDILKSNIDFLAIMTDVNLPNDMESVTFEEFRQEVQSNG